MDKNEIAARLKSLCERPFESDRDVRPQDIAILAALLRPEGEQSVSPAGQGPGPVTADLAAILSGNATDAQCHGLREAMTSDAVRLEAQSALAFVDGIEQAPLAAPAHLVEQVLASAGSVSATSKPDIWSRIAYHRLGRRRGQVVAACAVMLMAGGLLAGGLSWSLLQGPGDLPADHSVVPVSMTPKQGASLGDISPKSALAPAPVSAPAPAAAPPLASTVSPAPAPSPPAAQALADPCVPQSSATPEGGARSRVEARAAKPAPTRQLSTAAVVSTPEPGCSANLGATETGGYQADQGPVRAERPAAKIGRFDRDPPAAAASAPAASAPYSGAARPALPAMRPSAIQQPR